MPFQFSCFISYRHPQFVVEPNGVKVLVNALNIFAVNNANNNDILNVANGLKVTVSNVLNKSLNDITVCVVAGICV